MNKLPENMSVCQLVKQTEEGFSLIIATQLDSTHYRLECANCQSKLKFETIIEVEEDAPIGYCINLYFSEYDMKFLHDVYLFGKDLVDVTEGELTVHGLSISPMFIDNTTNIPWFLENCCVYVP